jgi:hypothetical protein
MHPSIPVQERNALVLDSGPPVESRLQVAGRDQSVEFENNANKGSVRSTHNNILITNR